MYCAIRTLLQRHPARDRFLELRRGRFLEQLFWKGIEEQRPAEGSGTGRSRGRSECEVLRGAEIGGDPSGRF